MVKAKTFLCEQDYSEELSYNILGGKIEANVISYHIMPTLGLEMLW